MVSRFPVGSPDDVLEALASSWDHMNAAIGVPWGKNYAMLLFDPTSNPEGSWGAIQAREHIPDSWVAHELAHDMFTILYHPQWLAEGTADFLAHIKSTNEENRKENLSRYEYLRRGCSTPYGLIENVLGSAMSYTRFGATERHEGDGYNCEYAMGAAFWLGMDLTLGREIVSTYLGELLKAGTIKSEEVDRRLSEGEIYQVLLSNTPLEKLEEFRALWADLHGQEMEAEHPGDREVLVAIGNTYRLQDKRANWLSDAPISQWEGVVTNGDGRVTSLILVGRVLTSIPPQLGELSMLEELYLSDNDLVGSIPSQLGELTNLKELYLTDFTGNSLTGCIPRTLLNVEWNDLEELNLPAC